MTYLTPVADGITNAARTIDYAHHEVHGGSFYHVWTNSAGLGSGSSINLCFTTTDTTDKWVHALVHAVGSVSTLIQIQEAPTVTAATGANMLAYNANRNSSKTSTVISTVDGAVGSVGVGCTIATPGTVIYEARFGGKGSSGETRADSEYILAENTTYAFVLTSAAPNNVVSLNLEWYEHTNL